MGYSGNQQTAHPLQEGSGVVLVEKFFSMQAGLFCPLQNIRIDLCTRMSTHTVKTIGIGSQSPNTRLAIQFDSQSQRITGIAATGTG